MSLWWSECDFSILWKNLDSLIKTPQTLSEQIKEPWGESLGVPEVLVVTRKLGFLPKKKNEVSLEGV